nr:MAG TPA: hypothetical protein [Caudoviricetes sp.]
MKTIFDTCRNWFRTLTIQPQNWQHDLRNKAGFPHGSKPKGEKSFAP